MQKEQESDADNIYREQLRFISLKPKIGSFCHFLADPTVSPKGTPLSYSHTTTMWHLFALSITRS